jgi:hypothetical protein
MSGNNDEQLGGPENMSNVEVNPVADVPVADVPVADVPVADVPVAADANSDAAANPVDAASNPDANPAANPVANPVDAANTVATTAAKTGADVLENIKFYVEIDLKDTNDPKVKFAKADVNNTIDTSKWVPLPLQPAITGGRVTKKRKNAIRKTVHRKKPRNSTSKKHTSTKKRQPKVR